LFIYVVLKSWFKSKTALRWLFVCALRERIPVLCIYFCGLFGHELHCVFRNAPFAWNSTALDRDL